MDEVRNQSPQMRILGRDLERLVLSRSVQSGAGTYRVGIDLPPGAYRTAGGPFCYWQRLSSLDGAPGAIIASDTPRGAVTVVVEPSDAGVGTSGCDLWRSV